LQADINCQLIKGLTPGGQYTDADTANGTDLAAAYALKVGYAVDALKVSAAYSSIEDEIGVVAANVATGSVQSKLYTEAWWNYGYVSVADTDSWNLTAEYDAGIAKLGAYYTSVDNGAAADAGDLKEIALTASKSFGPLDATLAYVSTDADGADSYNTVQAYLTLNF